MPPIASIEIFYFDTLFTSNLSFWWGLRSKPSKIQDSRIPYQITKQSETLRNLQNIEYRVFTCIMKICTCAKILRNPSSLCKLLLKNQKLKLLWSQVYCLTGVAKSSDFLQVPVWSNLFFKFCMKPSKSEYIAASRIK